MKTIPVGFSFINSEEEEIAEMKGDNRLGLGLG
jgi:hypothetical protein